MQLAHAQWAIPNVYPNEFMNMMAMKMIFKMNAER